jgi:putative transposase
MTRFKNKYRIPSSRLRTWDYSQPGMYFITICTKNRILQFGEIINHEMHLNETGIIADKFWAEIPEHFTNSSLDQFVIMPNHVHGIIVINDLIVETGHALSPKPDETPIISETGHALSLQKPNEQQRHFRFRNQGKNTISAMVGSFKSAVTKSARKINPYFEWQSRFHDHIIRSYDEYLRISDYIKCNPANWEKDKFYK